MSSYTAALSESFKFNLPAFPKQVALGISLGCTSFLLQTVIKKSCHVFAGIKFKQKQDTSVVPSHERFDKEFKNIVISFPLLGEVVFRGIVQTLLTTALANNIPWLSGRVSSTFNLSLARVVSATVIGIFSGIIDSLGYKEGTLALTLTNSLTGFSYGLAREKYGLPMTVIAAMNHNLLQVAFDKDYPNFCQLKTRLIWMPISQK